MNPRKSTFRRWIRKAAVMTQVALFGGTVGVGVAAMAVDTGLMYTARAELQNAADSAALAAASQLGQSSGAAESIDEGTLFAGLNQVAGVDVGLVSSDVVLGHAVLNGNRYEFHANQSPHDAVQVTLRRDHTVSDGPVSLLFARSFGGQGAEITAAAAAMIIPRDIDFVIDLSGSMNDDSELRHYKQFTSDSGGTRPGVQINLYDIWRYLPLSKGRNGIRNGANPAVAVQPPSGGSLQPGNGSGSPSTSGGTPVANPPVATGPSYGPRWGWMTGYGNFITLGSYTPVGDPGLAYIPKGSNTTDTDVGNNVTESGYSAAEKTALLSSTYDSTTTYYYNRVKVLLGIAGWKSGKSPGKYTGTGNGDARVDTGELTQTLTWPFSGGSWDTYIDYMVNSSEMRDTDSNFRYRYGIKTLVNFLLEKQASHALCPELAAVPERPLGSVKDAVQLMINTIIDLDTLDHCALEVFAQTGHHEVNLTVPTSGQQLPTLLQTIPATLYQRQAGHYDSITNIGIGIDKAITELSSSRARPSAAKIILLLTDGKPNTDSHGNSVADMAPAAVNWANNRANAAKALGFSIYTVGVGGDVYAPLLQDLASSPDMYYFADSTPDANGQPMYVSQLQEIFRTLGGNRPVRLIR